jgi:hypothetical protein
MKLFNIGLPSAAVLIVLLAVVFGGRTSSNTTTQALKPASDSATIDRDDKDGDGIPDLRDPDPYDANNDEEAPAPSLDSGPSPQPKPKRHKPKRTLTACDANIRIKPAQTTCGFAQNVFYAYWMNETEPGAFADSPGVPAYSNAAGKMFYVDCSGVSKIVCRADDGGYVTFSAAAVSAYTLENAKRYAATHELGDVPPPSDPAEPIDPAPSDPAPSNPDDNSDCDPNYEGACLDPSAYDYDCEGGSGDGPEYTGPVEVVGEDVYDLDRDGDGIGCDT